MLPLDPLRAPSDLAWASGPDQVFDGVPAVGLNGDSYYRPIFVSKEYLEYEGSVMFVDPSGRGKDETLRWSNAMNETDKDALTRAFNIARRDPIQRRRIDEALAAGKTSRGRPPAIARPSRLR